MQCICISIYACSGMCYLFSTDLMFTKHPMHLEIGITTKIKTLVMVFKLFIHAITPVITTSYNSTCTSQAHAYASLTVCTGHGAKVYIYCEIESLYSCLLIFLLLFVNILASWINWCSRKHFRYFHSSNLLHDKISLCMKASVIVNILAPNIPVIGPGLVSTSPDRRRRRRRRTMVLLLDHSFFRRLACK